jgi:hypothetical protein
MFFSVWFGDRPNELSFKVRCVGALQVNKEVNARQQEEELISRMLEAAEVCVFVCVLSADGV